MLRGQTLVSLSLTWKVSLGTVHKESSGCYLLKYDRNWIKIKSGYQDSPPKKKYMEQIYNKCFQLTPPHSDGL